MDVRLFDGAFLVNKLVPKDVTTFQEYASKIFIPYISSQSASRVDLVWDVYIPNSLKQITREHRGTGQRKRVMPDGKLPKNWHSFLLNCLHFYQSS